MNRRHEDPVVILGGGLTGISAALHLETPFLLCERDDRLGGLARTTVRDGYAFDCTGHWLHLRDATMRDLVMRHVGEQLVEVARKARIYSHGVYTPYPFQANLYGLPPAVIHNCLVGVFRAQQQQATAEPPRNFAAYILHHFGAGIAEHFMIPYNHKLWGVDPREMTSAWCSRFVPLPDVEQIIAGAVGASPPQLGYNIRFLYPKPGGIETVTRALVAQIDPAAIRCDAAAERIDPAAREVTVGGKVVPYRALIATLPLPQLVAMIDGAPENVRSASRALRATPIRYLNLAITCAPAHNWHWAYVPEPQFPFYRVGIFSNVAPTMAPPGCASLYVELADRQTDDLAIINATIDGLLEMRVLTRRSDVCFADLHTIDPAYVIFDDAYADALRCIHTYLEAQQIFARGRYGSWIYNAMEDSLIAGRDMAVQLNRDSR